MKPAAHPSRPERPQSPRERQDRRRQPERHHVGQRVELDAERRRGVGQPREEPVQRVEHHRDADEQRRGVEIAARRIDDAGVAAEQIRDREQRRQQEDAAPETARPIVRAPPRQRYEHRASRSIASTVSPATTCSPTATQHLRARRQEDVHPRAELHQPDPFARASCCPSYTADDAPRQMPTICRTTIG